MEYTKVLYFQHFFKYQCLHYNFNIDLGLVIKKPALQAASKQKIENHNTIKYLVDAKVYLVFDFHPKPPAAINIPKQTQITTRCAK